jgi:hypothetical protein
VADDIMLLGKDVADDDILLELDVEPLADDYILLELDVEPLADDDILL